MAEFDMFGDPIIKDANLTEPVEKPVENIFDTEMDESNVQTNGAEVKMETNGENLVEGKPAETIVIEDVIEDGGTIEDDEKKMEIIKKDSEMELYVSDTDMIQVTNVTTKATEEQMSVLFSFVGPIVAINLYPANDVSLVSNKVCFVKFSNKSDIIVALHLSNTVFIDRAVQVVEWRDEWPDESDAIIYCTPQDAVNNMNLGAGLDPTATALTLFNNPRLMTTVNPTAADEFRRQVCIGNIHEIVNEEQIKQYFESYAGNCSKIEFHDLRNGRKTTMDKDDVGHQVRYCTVVFEDASSVNPALQLDGQMFAGIPISVQHTKYSDIKHDAAPNAMSKLDRDFGSKKKSRSRSRSHRRRSRSRDRKRSSRKSRSKSRKRSKDRKRSRTPKKSSRSSKSTRRSRSRKRSSSRSKKSKKSSR